VDEAQQLLRGGDVAEEVDGDFLYGRAGHRQDADVRPHGTSIVSHAVQPRRRSAIRFQSAMRPSPRKTKTPSPAPAREAPSEPSLSFVVVPSSAKIALLGLEFVLVHLAPRVALP
jgi:hypothetical protein